MQKVIKNSLCLLLSAALFHVVQSQTLTLLDTIHTGNTSGSLGFTGGSDCWGWTAPDGTDYAFMGTLDGIAAVRAADQLLLDTLQGPETMDPYFHRDIKTYGHYAYMTGEMLGRRKGVMIIDLQYLPDSLHFVRSWTIPFQVRSHNLSIDTTNGYMYVLDSQYKGCYILDIHTDPENPDSVGFITTGDIHDVYARRDTAWIAEGNNGAYSVWNCSDKGNPVMYGRINLPSFGYCHNIWPSDDGKYFVTAEETPDKTVKIWNMTDPGNITLEGEYLAPCSLVHNVHVMGKYIVCSHYESGITILDWSIPSDPVEVAHYDTYPLDEVPEFHGCWGAFPFSRNGYVYASNMEGEFFIFRYPTVGADDPAAMNQNLVERVWPNPASELMEISLNESGRGPVRTELVDATGRSVYKHVFDLKEGIKIPVAGMSPGVYNLRVQSGSQAQTVRVLVAK